MDFDRFFDFEEDIFMEIPSQAHALDTPPQFSFPELSDDKSADLNSAHSSDKNA